MIQNQSPDQSQESPAAVETQGVPEARALVVALLRSPPDAKAQKCQEDVLAVEEHAYGGQKG